MAHIAGLGALDVGDTNTMRIESKRRCHREPPRGRIGIENASRTAADSLQDCIHGQQTDGDQFHFDPATYLETIREEMPAYDELQDAVAEATADIHAEQVFELGVSTGRTSRRILDLNPEAELVGIDESAKMLAAASADVAADLRVSHLQDPLPEGNFDLVVSALAVHHLDGAGKADLFARVANRLRPGGRFVLGDVVVPEDGRRCHTNRRRVRPAEHHRRRSGSPEHNAEQVLCCPAAALGRHHRPSKLAMRGSILFLLSTTARCPPRALGQRRRQVLDRSSRPAEPIARRPRRLNQVATLTRRAGPASNCDPRERR
jgi:tRNA (cmo5U34)-methyltransferase